MIYKAWSSIEEVPYCLSRSSIKFHGHTGQKIANFDPNWAFLDCDCSLNSPMGLKRCTKLGVQKRCPIVFRGHPSNLKVTWTEKSMIWIQFLAAIKFLRFACKYPSDVLSNELEKYSFESTDTFPRWPCLKPLDLSYAFDSQYREDIHSKMKKKKLFEILKMDTHAQIIVYWPTSFDKQPFMPTCCSMGVIEDVHLVIVFRVRYRLFSF